MPTQNATNTSNPITVSQGGTGAATLTGLVSGNGTAALSASAITQYNVLVAGASNAVVSISPSTSGFVLTSNGTSANPTFKVLPTSLGTIAGNTGTATGTTITFDATTNAGSSISFSATGSTVSLNVTDGNINTLLGNGAGNGSITGQFNSGFGDQTLKSLTSGGQNTAVGTLAGGLITSGQYNTYVGVNAGNNIKTGLYNVGLGQLAGSGYTTNENSNISIGYNTAGTAGESNTLRIGNATAPGPGGLAASYIAGITGKTSAAGAAVYVNAANLLGTSTSALRFKENVHDIGTDSERIYDLRPVSFTYKYNPPHVMQEDTLLKQYGLIAEEVENVIPEMVIYDLEGTIQTLRYQYLAPLLLNEIQKLKKEIETLKKGSSNE